MFKIGSCRLNYLNNLNVYNQLYFTHTSNEVIQLLEFLSGKNNNGIFINAFPDDFNERINEMKDNIKNCEYILIEFSSIKKLIDINGIHYPSVELGRQYKNHKLKAILSTKEEIIQNIHKIMELISKYKNVKKIIFHGHYDIGVKNRKVIDDALLEFDLKYGNLYSSRMSVVIIKEVFSGYDAKKTCKLKVNKPDYNHFSNYGKKLLHTNLLKLIR